MFYNVQLNELSNTWKQSARSRRSREESLFGISGLIDMSDAMISLRKPKTF